MFLILALLGMHVGQVDLDAKNTTHLTWGRYTITIQKLDPETGRPERCRITDNSGHVLVEIKAWKFSEIKNVKLVDSKQNDLVINSCSGGANCCYDSLFFTKKNGLHNILHVFRGHNEDEGDGLNLKDLNKDGIPEVVCMVDLPEPPGGFSEKNYNHSPPLGLVLGWNGHRYTNQTKRYPLIALKIANEYKTSVIESFGTKAEKGISAPVFPILGYYTNMIAAGKGPQAHTYLLQHLPKYLRSWLKTNDMKIRQAVAESNDSFGIVKNNKIDLLR